MEMPATMSSTKLLIADDSRVARIMIRGHVNRHRPDWQVIEASSGTEAVALARSAQPDFITMDVNMPEMDGFDAAAQILAVRPGARIVMLTANIQEASRERAASLGLAFVRKPPTEQAVQELLSVFAGQR